jgi:transcriptional regulator with XRE-family HTH domain
MQAASLVDALKRLLKSQGITYAHVAAGLGLSLAGVKRMFSRRDFTLQRLEDICRIARVDFAALMRAVAEEPSGLAQLADEQERELVSDPRLMLVALCAVGNWTFEQIVDTYSMTRAECIRYLTRLDRFRIIELQADNRIRPLISRTFSWRPDGPIQRYFHARVEAEFLGSRFDRRDELFLFVSGMLSRRGSAELIAKLKDLARDFAELHRDDVAMPLAERHGTSLLLATRAWEPRAFVELRRADRPPAPAGGALHPGFVPSPPPNGRRRRSK